MSETISDTWTVGASVGGSVGFIQSVSFTASTSWKDDLAKDKGYHQPRQEGERMLELETIKMKTYFQLRTRDTIRRNGRLRLDRRNAVSPREVSCQCYATPNERRLTCYISETNGSLWRLRPDAMARHLEAPPVLCCWEHPLA